MAITDSSKLRGASTLYSEAYATAFVPNENLSWQALAHSEPLSEGTKFFDYQFLSEFATAKKWNQAKEYTSPRANNHSIPVELYHASTQISRLDWDSNPAKVRQTLEAWLKSDAQTGFIGALVSQKLWACATDLGYDGVSLANDSHPYADSNTADNLLTDAFSREALLTAVETMAGFRGPNGRLLGCKADTLVVCSQANYNTAIEIVTSGLRVKTVTSEGVAAIDNVGVLTNLKVVFDPFATDTNDWCVLDTRPGRQALAVGVLKAPTPKDDADEYSHEPVVHVSLEAALAIGYGPWQSIVKSSVA